MKLLKRSFPHPVLGNGDDVPGAAFQAALEMKTDAANAYIDVNIACSSKVINKLIANRDAQYVLHVECSNTIFRKVFKFKDKQKQFAIPIDDLNDDVEVNCFVCATKTIEKYKIDGMHEDYKKTTFTLSKGDILAVSESHVFPVESNFDSSKRIGSIMLIQESEYDGDRPTEVMLENDRIVVVLSKNDFVGYKSLKGADQLLIPATNAIVLPVLVEALYAIESVEGDSFQDYRWFRSLSRRIEDLDLDKEQSVLVKAQKLLDLPIKRSLVCTTQFMHDASI